jgi:3-phosphoshikimate 1-carboxyvinyltransferase
MFQFAGDMILSKSWLNRAQIIYHFAGVSFPFSSTADDVKHLKNAIASIGHSQEFHLGQGGTSFRFFVFLVSKLTGNFRIFAEPQLLGRPQKPLSETLGQLGVACAAREKYFEITGEGWSNSGTVTCDAGLSSQFISGLLLSCWNLENDLTIKVPKPLMSEEYLNMTLKMLQECGMKIETSDDPKEIIYTVFKKQTPHISHLTPEADVSSAFSLAAAAVVNGSAEIRNWPVNSTQPDVAFLKAFQQMNIRFSESHGVLKVEKHNTWSGCEMNIGNSPDLFPVLSALCALGDGKSKLYGAGHLKVKESDRLAKTFELLKLCGVKFEELPDGIIIYGRSFSEPAKPVVYDPAGDHRMAMAAALFKLAGFNIQILNRECVEKSYPNFWKDTGL